MIRPVFQYAAMILKLALILFSSSLLHDVMAQAPSTPSVSLYTGETPVADQSAKELERGMPLALAEVLHKLSGIRNLEEQPGLDPEAVKARLGEARSMAVTFYYRNRNVLLPDGTTTPELRMVAEFSRAAVDRLAQELQLPLWKPERKPLTVWLVVDDGTERAIFPIELEYAWGAMESVAQTRGLPLVRPQPGPEGQYGVDEQLLWGGYTEELTAAGMTDVLVIAARREGPEWNARMNLEYQGKSWTWRSRDIAIETALAEGMHMAVTEIANAHSIAAADRGSSSLEITVTGVQNASDYARCLAYLEKVSVVESVRVRRAGPGRVYFELGLNALPEHFSDAVAEDGVLVPLATDGEYSLQP